MWEAFIEELNEFIKNQQNRDYISKIKIYDKFVVISSSLN